MAVWYGRLEVFAFCVQLLAAFAPSVPLHLRTSALDLSNNLIFGTVPSDLSLLTRTLCPSCFRYITDVIDANYRDT